MEGGSFTPIGLPQAPVSGPRDQSLGSQAPSTSSEAAVQDDDIPMASRVEIEQECRLPQLRAAAMAADEAVEDVAQNLLNVLSTLDTTRRSARVAAEAFLLSACTAHAESIRSLVALERASLEDRLQHIRELEAVVEKVNVRSDLDQYITADRQVRGGSTWLGDYDDGGVASALAVLSSHVDGDTGIGRTRVHSDGWDAKQDPDETPESLEEAVEELFEQNVDFENAEARNKLEETVQRLCRVAADRSSQMVARRSTICYALNAKRSAAEIPTSTQFHGLVRLFRSILSGCEGDVGSVANAKMCMMLAQTFYLKEGEGRDNRVFVRNRLANHGLWADDEFWDQALYQCVAESLTHSGVLSNFERKKAPQSEWVEESKIHWHDLHPMERTEAASQVHAVVFAQLGALAHSMMEFGCGMERACAFVRRMSVRNQLPLAQRTMLLQHLLRTQEGDPK